MSDGTFERLHRLFDQHRQAPASGVPDAAVGSRDAAVTEPRLGGESDAARELARLFGRGDTPNFARGGDAQAGDALSAGPPSVRRSIAPHHRITPQSEEAEARPFDGRYMRTNPVAQVQSAADLARCEPVMVPETDFAQPPVEDVREDEIEDTYEVAGDEIGSEDEAEFEFEPARAGGPGSDFTAPPKRRGLIGIAIVGLGLAACGGAAALTYNKWFKSHPSASTAIIRADTSPTKVAATGSDTGAKSINERLGDRSGDRLVRRDEDPVDVRAVSNFNPFGSPAVLSSAPPQGASTASSSGPTSATEPKRVRTVAIRVDQPAPDRSAGAGAPQPRPVGPATQAASAAPADAVPSRTASVRPAEGSSFFVQVSAQKSEAEAQASFRSLQSKYAVLSGRQVLIRRKDQGERGIFYAAQVGPFGAKADADQLCASLKSAGGSCFVQRN